MVMLRKVCFSKRKYKIAETIILDTDTEYIQRTSIDCNLSPNIKYDNWITGKWKTYSEKEDRPRKSKSLVITVFGFFWELLNLVERKIA